MKTTLILLVEDVEDDVFLFRRALGALSFHGELRVVNTASEARAYFEGTGGYADRSYYPFPDLIVCDYRLRGETGAQFLSWLQIHPDRGAIPFVLFTGSISVGKGETVVRAGARACFTKSGDFATLKQSVAEMLQHIDAPRHSGPPSSDRDQSQAR